MNTLKRITLATLVALAASCLPAVPGVPLAGTAWASSIVVLVNDDPVTEYDVKQRTSLIRLTSGGKGTRQQAIDELIEEKLKQQAAGRLGISADEAEVDQAYANIATRVKLSPSQLSQALSQNGVNPETLKRRLRADLAWRDVVRSQMRREVNIRDTDVQAELSKRGEEAKSTSYRYTLLPTIFVIPDGSSQAYIRQRMQDASRYSQQFPGCDKARELAKNFRDTVVQDEMRRSSTDLPEELQKRLAGIPIGKASPPDKIDKGVQVIGVCQREEVQDTVAAQNEIRSEMLNEEGQRLSRRLLIDLKQAAVIERR